MSGNVIDEFIDEFNFSPMVPIISLSFRRASHNYVCSSGRRALLDNLTQDRPSCSSSMCAASPAPTQGCRRAAYMPLICLAALLHAHCTRTPRAYITLAHANHPHQPYHSHQPCTYAHVSTGLLVDGLAFHPSPGLDVSRAASWLGARSTGRGLH